MPGPDDDYPWDVGRTEAETEFLSCLRELSADRAVFDAWTFYPQLVVTLTVVDPDEGGVVRTLRIDFDASGLRGGEDPSGQIDPDLDPDSPDYFELLSPGSTAEAASHGFEWLARQGRRPIDRREWVGPDHTWVQWVLVEPTARPLVARYFNRPDRPPDRVVRLPGVELGRAE